MPKLKPLSKPEDMKAIPTTEPILVALEPEATGQESENNDQLKVEKKDQFSTDDGSRTLQEQLEALQAANKTEKEGREAAERAANEAWQQAQQAQQQITILKTENSDSQLDMMNASLASAQSELTSAKAEMAQAYDRADGPAIAEANAKIGRASAKVVNYEGAVAELDARKKQAPKQEQQPVIQPQQHDLASQINNNPNLMPAEREWLLKHQDAYGARNDELNVGWKRATQGQGLQRGTPEYFAFLDSFMGYQSKNQDGSSMHQSEGRTSVSAPVTRDNNTSTNGQRQIPNQIQLTPEERDMARSMGLTDIAYAQQKRNLIVDKQANPERYGRTS